MDEYTIFVHGIPHTVRLSAEDAKRLGAEKVQSKAVKPANKSAEDGE